MIRLKKFIEATYTQQGGFSDPTRYLIGERSGKPDSTMGKSKKEFSIVQNHKFEKSWPRIDTQRK
jgi:hypothetical protein